MTDREMKYQVGQQFLIRSDTATLPFRVRINAVDEPMNCYELQKISDRCKFWLNEQQLENWIANVDNTR